MTSRSPTPPGLDRRARRRQETIEEILDIAVDVMTEEGVTGLNLAQVARRLGIQPPSLYKYFPSLLAVYDELFRRGQIEHLRVMREAMAGKEPGLPALAAGLDAAGRWALANRAVAQLMFWRPVPSFEPSPEAFEPSIGLLALHREALADAVAAGQLGPAADSDDAVWLISTMISGVLTQTFANEPDGRWGEGRFTPQFPRLLSTLPTLYPPA
ncbi:MAG TPA: TetR/AcrR family transcriptional regulator [Pseudonocardia sp.]|jgi:AcrR family transcriptional regulator|nr:TetR/AcrR family transcriptional regulator [Pseudonocardia sp.]